MCRRETWKGLRDRLCISSFDVMTYDIGSTQIIIRLTKHVQMIHQNSG